MTSGISEHEKLAQSRFDDWSASATFQRLRPWLMFVQRNVLGQIDWPRTQRILDVACGNGWLVFEAAQRLRADDDKALACGCDLSEGMLQQRHDVRGPAARSRFVAATAQQLPFADDSFDAIMCTAAFHHFPEPRDSLLEFQRVLRPGGVVLVSDSCRDVSIGNWIWDRLHRWFEAGHVQYYRRDEMVGLFESAGFDDVQVTDLHPSFAETKKLVRKLTLFKAFAS